MPNEKTLQRYFDYLMVYTNTISEFSDELKSICKKKRSGETIINGKKYTYFATNNGVSILNKKNDLEMTFSFNTEENSVYFEKYNFHSFIESDLNASGLGKNFASNKIVRTKEFDECFEKLLSSNKISKKDKGYII